MTRAGKPGRRGQPTRIGTLRPSHLLTGSGVGSIVDLPNMSVVVRGIDSWSRTHANEITEPRLLDQVKAILGNQVRALVAPPRDPEDDPRGDIGVPVIPFPRWVRCPACYRLGPLDPPGQFELIHPNARRPDLVRWVHTGCAKQHNAPSRRRACLPARFLVTCEDGHLDDFPYVDYVHKGAPCPAPRMTMRDLGSPLRPVVIVRCEECQLHRNIQDVAGRDKWDELPACRGRHPHLNEFRPCGKNLRLTVLGASDLWFGVTASALHLPERGDEAVIAAHWDFLGVQTDKTALAGIISQVDALRDLRDRPVDDVLAMIETYRAAGGPPAPDTTGDLLGAEWRLLSRPTTKGQDEDFRAVPTAVPDGYEDRLDQVVLVTRLREVRALLGFTRGSAPEPHDLDSFEPLPLSRSTPLGFVPAVEQRGEGIFLQLREDRVSEWVDRVSDHRRIESLWAAQKRWWDSRARTHDRGFQPARYLLLHTLSHLLIRQVALECGYSSASISERLYVGTLAEPTAGILLSTAASDSEGTLGGLVALGEARHLGRLLKRAFEDAEYCSSDPLCAEHEPTKPSEVLHGAACHACLFVSETSCEANNRWLDRSVLTDRAGDGLAFPG